MVSMVVWAADTRRRQCAAIRLNAGDELGRALAGWGRAGPRDVLLWALLRRSVLAGAGDSDESRASFRMGGAALGSTA